MYGDKNHSNVAPVGKTCCLVLVGLSYWNPPLVEFGYTRTIPPPIMAKTSFACLKVASKACNPRARTVQDIFNDEEK
jgi:hypothetical protein